MLEEQLINQLYEKPERDAIVDALGILHKLGVFTHQVKENEMRVVKSFTSKPAGDLAQDILQVQQTNRSLLALHELAGKLKKDDENA